MSVIDLRWLRFHVLLSHRSIILCILVGIGTILSYSDSAFAQELKLHFQTGNGVRSPLLSPIPSTVAAGIYHSCGILAGGARCWGDNRDGQVGDGTAAERHVATRPLGLNEPATAISAGAYHSCVLISNSVKCWGHNTYGQVGDGSTILRFMPVDVMALGPNVVAISGGGFHTCATALNGDVKCWGANFSGQLGDGTTIDQHTPVSVGKLGSVVAISAGYAHTCALTQSGAIKCWGDNSYGQLGDGTVGNYQTDPVFVNGLGGKAIAVASGAIFTCAVMNNGDLKCWGDNSFGELGDGTNINHALPAKVIGLNGNATLVAAGTTFACALINRTAQCWGDNSSGQLGDGTTANRTSPVDVTGLSEINDIAAGDEHTCAQTDSSIKCWGRDLFGELGDNGYLFRTSPVGVIGITSAIGIGAGGHHTCALMGGGVKCWGINWHGQVGDGTVWDRLTPVDVSNLASGVTSITVGYAHNCARMDVGAVKCWGRNASGQLGDNTLTDRLTPVQVMGMASNVNFVASGYSHTCAIMNNGGVKCWGDNTYGEIGNGTFGSTNFRTAPVDVIGLSNVVAVATGNSYSCALTSNGGVKCWGWNSYGQLGDGTTTDHILPMDVVGLSSGVIAISAGWYHACALIGTGALKCWGLNGAGQLGDGSMNDRKMPVEVTGMTSGVSQVAAGWLHTCAITGGGVVKCWGWNANGAIGDGTTTTRLTPVTVINLNGGANTISAGQNYSCALITGNAKCWGFNYYGQLGNGEAGHRTFPATVVWLQNYFLPLISR